MRYRSYSEEETKRVLELKCQGLSTRQISDLTTVPQYMVKRMCRRANLYTPKCEWSRLTKEGVGPIKEKRSEAIKQAWNSPELKSFASTRSKNLWNDPTTRDRILESRRMAREQNPIRSKYSVKDVLGVILTTNFRFHSECPDDTPINLVKEYAVECFCGYKWQPDLYDLIIGRIRSCGCVKSKPQRDLYSFVKETVGPEVDVKNDDRKTLKDFKLELDTYIPSKKLAIEYCGLGWHGQLHLGEKARLKHYKKLQACEKMGIRLVTIFSDEYIQRPEVVKSYLKTILGAPLQRLGARECELLRVDSGIAFDFQEKNHVQGGRHGLAYALKHDGKVVAAATFARLRIKGQWEMVRYCVASGLSIPGGLARILKKFIEEQTPSKIVSFSDRRWSLGKIYESHGFRRVSTSRPSYWYFRRGHQELRYHKFGFRKDRIGALPGESEWKAALRLGYDRIWDCGKDRWVLEL